MRPLTTRTRWARALAATLVALAATSCSLLNIGETDVDPLAEIRSRPSFEDIVATYSRMEQEIRDAITAVAPTVVWRLERAGIKSACAKPYDHTDADKTGLDSWGAPGGIPEDKWVAAYTAARTVAARYGFTDIATVLDKPGDHQVRFRNPADNAFTNLGTLVNVVLATFTGCNLPQAKLTAPPPTTS